MTHKADDKTNAVVKALSSYGMPHDRIATYIGISKNTLYKYYKPVLDTAQIDKIMRVSDSLYQSAIEGNTTSMIFFLKTQGSKYGWREADKEVAEDKPNIGRIQIEVLEGRAEVKNA